MGCVAWPACARRRPQSAPVPGRPRPTQPELRRSMVHAGIPCVCACRGVLNVVHGTRDVVNQILDHRDIRAISFVGSDQVGPRSGIRVN